MVKYIGKLNNEILNLPRYELIKKLMELSMMSDHKSAHSTADMLLIEYINDQGIKEAYSKINKQC